MTPPDTSTILDDNARFRAHWTIFLPSIVVTILYGGLWLFLFALGKGDSALARLVFLVLFLVVPVLLVRSYLRYAVFGLLVGRQALTYRRGWLRPRWHRVQLDDLAGVRAAPGPLAGLFGGGALVISRFDDADIRLYDLDAPEDAARQISRRLRGVQGRIRPL